MHSAEAKAEYMLFHSQRFGDCTGLEPSANFNSAPTSNSFGAAPAAPAFDSNSLFMQQSSIPQQAAPVNQFGAGGGMNFMQQTPNMTAWPVSGPPGQSITWKMWPVTALSGR